MVVGVAGVVCVEEEEEVAVVVDEDGKNKSPPEWWLRCCRCGEVRRGRREREIATGKDGATLHRRRDFLIIKRLVCVCGMQLCVIWTCGDVLTSAPRGRSEGRHPCWWQKEHQVTHIQFAWYEMFCVGSGNLIVVALGTERKPGNL